MAAKSARKPSDDDRAGDHVRLCVVTRDERPPEDLIRFVAAPDGTITPDVARRLPGRGVWVTADRAAIEAAVTGKAFARSLKRQIIVPANLADTVERLLVQRTMDALALANKAGLAVAGFDKVHETISTGAARVLAHGSDAAADGRGKLDRKFLAVQHDTANPGAIVEVLAIAQLSLAMGRSNVVHAALIHGGATVKFAGEAERLKRYRSGIGRPLVPRNALAAPIEQV